MKKMGEILPSRNINENDEKDIQVQKQLQSNKQMVALKQDQNSSNSIMCKVLSELENLAIVLGYKEKPKFEFYSSKSKDIKQIIEKIVFQMTIFESSYKSFIKKNPNKQYEYPDNLKCEDILKIIKNWKESVKKSKSNKSYECYYDEFANILSNKNLSDEFNNKFQNLGEDSEKLTNEELKRIMNAGALATCLTNEKNEEIEKTINEKGDYKIKVVLGGNRKDNKFYKNMEKYEEKLDKLKKDLYINLDLILGYLELYASLKTKKINKLNVKYSFNIKNKDIEKKILSEYSKLLDKFKEISNQLFNEFSFELTKEEKDKIREDLENWKKNIDEKYQIVEFDEAIDCICESGESMK